VDFIEKLVGAETAQRWLDDSPLPELAMELSAGEHQVIDPEKGLGLFTLPKFDGVVALMGVIDDERALAVVVEQLEKRGGFATSQPKGAMRVRSESGKEMLLFTDRGYLYVALPDRTGIEISADEKTASEKAADPLEVMEAVHASA